MQLMTSTKLTAQIRSIKGNAIKFREQVQEALVSCAYYAYKDGNTNPFNQLLDAVGTATRIKGLAAWSEVHGCVVVKNGKFELNKTARKVSDVTDEASFAEYIKDIEASPKWYDIVEKEPVVSIFDATSYLEGVLKTLEKKGANDAKAFLEKAVNEYKQADALIKMKLEAMGDAPM